MKIKIRRNIYSRGASVIQHHSTWFILYIYGHILRTANRYRIWNICDCTQKIFWTDLNVPRTRKEENCKQALCEEFYAMCQDRLYFIAHCFGASLYGIIIKINENLHKESKANKLIWNESQFFFFQITTKLSSATRLHNPNLINIPCKISILIAIISLFVFIVSIFS